MSAPATDPPRPPAADLRLLPAAVAAWVTAAVLVGVPDAAGPVAIACWALAGVATAAAVLRRHGSSGRAPVARAAVAQGGVALGAVALVLAAVAGVASSVAILGPSRAPPALLQAHEFEVVATESAAVGADRVRGTVGAAPLLLVGLDASRAIPIGTVLRVRGSIDPAAPGGSIVGVLAAAAPPTVIAEPPPVLALAEHLRAGFRDLAAGLPGDGAALLPGLAIGDDAGVPEALAAAMAATSLTHLTAVSGANCAVVVGAGLLLAGAAGLPRRGRLGVAAGLLVAFVVLVTPQPSVVRAGVMAALALVGLALDRPVRGVPLLALAVLIVLASDPWAAREFGFVLSVLATAGLLLLAGPLARRLASWMPRAVAIAVAVPAAAQTACMPALVLLDPALPLSGVAANLLAAPAAPAATMLGLVACLLAPIAPPVATAVAWAAWVPSAWIAGIATTIAGLPLGRIAWPDGVVGVGIAIASSGAVWVWAAAAGRPARVAGAALLVASIAAAACGLGVRVAESFTRPRDWVVAQCDVGQGDAVLLRAGGEVALIDTGQQPARLSACLDAVGVSRLRLAVLTHFDLDHVGGVDAILGRVDEVLVGPTDARGEQTVVAPVRAAGAVVREVARGDRGMLGSVPWRVLWPPVGAPGLEPGNESSVVLEVGGAVPTLLLGDLGAVEQERLVGLGGLGRVAVLKVSHHGSADQSARLTAAVAPAVALIGVGADNGYGHPAQATVAALAAVGAEIARSDRDGLVLVTPTTDGVALWRERGATGTGAAGAAAVDGRASPVAARLVRVGSGGLHGGSNGAGRTAHRRLRVGVELGSHPSCPRRARDRPGAVPGGSRGEPTARPPPRRGPESRGDRPRRRHRVGRRPAYPREPIALRRAAPHPGQRRREVHRRVPR